jgi:hypothetical protein
MQPESSNRKRALHLPENEKSSRPVGRFQFVKRHQKNHLTEEFDIITLRVDLISLVVLKLI